MASFVESATLAVKDDSSKKIDKINDSLKKLYATAKRTAKALDTLNFEPKGLTNASRKINRVQADLNKLGRTKVRPTLDISGINSQLNKLSNKKVTVTLAANTTALNNQLGRSMRHSFDPLRSIGREIAEDIRNAIIQGFKTAVSEGYKERDVADTRMAVQNLSSGDQKLINAAVTTVANETRAFNRNQLLGMASETAGIANNAPQVMAEILRAEARLGANLIRLGATAEEAQEGLFKFIKAGESSGRITDAEGNIVPAKLTEFADVLAQAQSIIGRELTPGLVEKTFKSLRVSKGTLDNDALVGALLLAEELGSTAGVGINQMIKNLAGGTTKKTINNQADQGLIKTMEKYIGSVNGKPVKELTGESVDEDLLRSNFIQFVAQEVIPAMKAQGLDPNNRVDAAKEAAKITSDRSAVDTLAGVISRIANLQNTIERARENNVSPARQAEIDAESGTLALSSAFQQLQGAAGSLANAFEGPLITSMNAVSDAARTVSQFIEGPDGTPNMTNAGIVAGGGIAAVIAGALGLKGGYNWLTGSGKQTAAVLLNTSALDRNTAALLASTGKSTLPNVIAAGTPTTKAFSIGMQALKAVGILAAVQSAFDLGKWADPGGNLWGLTSGIDKWSKENFGFDPSQDASKLLPAVETMQRTFLPFLNGVETLSNLFSKVGDPGRTSIGVVNELALMNSEFPGKTKDDLGMGIRSETDHLRDTLTTSATSSAETLGGGIVQGAQTAAGILANAIAQAAQNIRINAQATPGTQIAPVDTGANPLSRHH